MAFAPGDIVLFESAVAGKMKFHLCFCVEYDNEVHSFIYLNSDGGFRDQFVVDCARIQGMQASRTGQTVFDCPTVHRKTTAQLTNLRSKLICQLPKEVAEEFLQFARTITSMTERDHANLIRMLESLLAA
jgi:hypothetical protein